MSGGEHFPLTKSHHISNSFKSAHSLYQSLFSVFEMFRLNKSLHNNDLCETVLC